jgi:hypothetical protein
MARHAPLSKPAHGFDDRVRPPIYARNLPREIAIMQPDFVMFDAAFIRALELLHANPYVNLRAAIPAEYPALDVGEVEKVIELARIADPRTFGIGTVGRGRKGYDR